MASIFCYRVRMLKSLREVTKCCGVLLPIWLKRQWRQYFVHVNDECKEINKFQHGDILFLLLYNGVKKYSSMYVKERKLSKLGIMWVIHVCESSILRGKISSYPGARSRWYCHSRIARRKKRDKGMKTKNILSL